MSNMLFSPLNVAHAIFKSTPSFLRPVPNFYYKRPTMAIPGNSTWYIAVGIYANFQYFLSPFFKKPFILWKIPEL